ncbi:MAG: 6-bladed beta-propeller [Phycisphaerales bacterium]
MNPFRPSIIVRRLAIGLLSGIVVSTAGCSSTPSAADAPKADVKGSYAFWPAFPDDPRVQFVKSFSSSEDVAKSEASALEKIVFGKELEAAATINKPYGVAMRDGKIYVCDMRGKSLVILDLKKQQTRMLGLTGVNRLSHPVGVAVADDGQLYVADNERGAIVEYDAQERYSRAFGFPKFKPSSVAVHGDRVYATDMAQQNVVVFDRTSGDKIASIGTIGDGDGQFRLPLGLAVDPKGDVYVADVMRCRVQKFSPDGTFIAGVGTQGDVAGSFARPKHIAIDSDGILYVVDAAFQNVQMFDSNLQLLMSFGAAGAFPGAMNLPAGIGVADGDVELVRPLIHPGFDAKRLIIVSNQFGKDAISIYALGEKRAGYTAADLSKAAIKVNPGLGASPERLKLQEAGLGPEPLPTDDGANSGADNSGAPGAPPKQPESPPKPVGVNPRPTVPPGGQPGAQP